MTKNEYEALRPEIKGLWIGFEISSMCRNGIGCDCCPIGTVGRKGETLGCEEPEKCPEETWNALKQWVDENEGWLFDKPKKRTKIW